MVDSKIKLAIVGVGRMGITHYSIINSHQDVEIKAVVDTSSLVLNLMKKYLKGINTYDDFNKLFNVEVLDAIINCTPPVLHYPIALKAAEKKIKVREGVYVAVTGPTFETRAEYKKILTLGGDAVCMSTVQEVIT